MYEYRADSFGIKSIADKIDSNGYLRIKGTFTRAGIFKYLQPDGTWRRELRHPDDVAAENSVKTLKLVPVAPVDYHKKVNASSHVPNSQDKPNDTARFKSIGVTGENIIVTSDAALDGSLSIHDQATIQELLRADAAGEPLPEISASYSFPSLDDIPGYFDGSKWGIESGEYDARQNPPFSYGHVTLVDRGRAGSRCQIRADKAQNETQNEDDKMGDKIKTRAPVIEIGSGDNLFRADQLEIEETSDTLRLIEQRQKIAFFAQTEAARADKAEGEISILQKENKELKEKSAGLKTDEEFRSDLKESLDLLSKCRDLGLETGDDVSPKALQMLIIKNQSPDDEQRADTDDSYRAGVFSAISRDWKQRVSNARMLKGLEQGIEDFINSPNPGAELKYDQFPV